MEFSKEEIDVLAEASYKSFQDAREWAWYIPWTQLNSFEKMCFRTSSKAVAQRAVEMAEGKRVQA